MDIAFLMTEIEKTRLSVLNGKVFTGIGQLLKLKRSGYDVDITLVEDILKLPRLLEYLYDETALGNATMAIRCLAALKELNCDIEPRKINYIRYKKLSMLGLDMNSYYAKARPVFQRLLYTLQSFFVHIGDYRECILHKAENRMTFEEDIIIRFPNDSFRDLFLQLAFQEAIRQGLSFHWENHHTRYNEDLTGKISWSLIQDGRPLETEWYRGVKSIFDRFIASLQEKLERLEMPRHMNGPRDDGELLWIIFSRDSVVSQRLGKAMRHYRVIQIKDINLLQKYLAREKSNFASFVLHVDFADHQLLHTIVEHKLHQPTSGAPFIIFADGKFFQVMKDSSLLFPGCEYINELTPENVLNMEFILSKVRENRRRFIRLPMGLECRAEFDDDVEHTRAKPISVGGTYVKTHRIVPIFTNSRIALFDRESGFETETRGKVVYNGKGGSAISFDNIIPYEKFKELREMVLERHYKILDTLARSRF
ncbi:MAG: hypothetical protein JXQ27_13835 [Acidobacteria bacterium]|nr:hypothetical protein [Acidobacteriota bacterium]